MWLKVWLKCEIRKTLLEKLLFVPGETETVSLFSESFLMSSLSSDTSSLSDDSNDLSDTSSLSSDLSSSDSENETKDKTKISYFFILFKWKIYNNNHILFKFRKNFL